ncbi:hypothetical protein EPI10_016037 [Gossypium australe]|uniref:Uncharacterized protein n=1 Tax=Gossypium australe TaxID=47621 RepID=A0A5B6VMI1_9ROSI|nr:hypothetical protein EPI10_016037 [Gossypium australe]
MFYHTLQYLSNLLWGKHQLDANVRVSEIRDRGDFKADKEVSINLKMSFLATRRTLSDVQKGELTMHD